MVQTGGISPTPDKSQPISTPGSSLEGIGGNVDISNINVKTLGDLKNVLVGRLGKEKGEKLYNQFIQSIALGMLSNMRVSEKAAQKAAKKMGGPDKDGG